jgi:hypothetical protein
MAYPVQIGATLAIGGQVAITGYIVVSEKNGGANIDMEDIDAASGVRSTRIIFKVDAKKELELIALTGSTFAEFPEGTMCTATGLTTFFVDSCNITETKGATRATVSMTNIGIP